MTFIKIRNHSWSLSLLSFLLTSCAEFSKADGLDVSNFMGQDKLTYQAKFYSGNMPYENQQQVMVIYTSENGRFYFWLSLRPIGVNYPNEKRAEEVANRLEQYRQEKISSLAWGTLNNEQIICAYTEKNPRKCRLVVTVPPGVDVKEVLTLLQCKLNSPDDPKCSAPIKT